MDDYLVEAAEWLCSDVPNAKGTPDYEVILDTAKQAILNPGDADRQSTALLLIFNISQVYSSFFSNIESLLDILDALLPLFVISNLPDAATLKILHKLLINVVNRLLEACVHEDLVFLTLMHDTLIGIIQNTLDAELLVMSLELCDLLVPLYVDDDMIYELFQCGIISSIFDSSTLELLMEPATPSSHGICEKITGLDLIISIAQKLITFFLFASNERYEVATINSNDILIFLSRISLILSRQRSNYVIRDHDVLSDDIFSESIRANEEFYILESMSLPTELSIIDLLNQVLLHSLAIENVFEQEDYLTKYLVGGSVASLMFEATENNSKWTLENNGFVRTNSKKSIETELTSGRRVFGFCLTYGIISMVSQKSLSIGRIYEVWEDAILCRKYFSSENIARFLVVFLQSIVRVHFGSINFLRSRGSTEENGECEFERANNGVASAENTLGPAATLKDINSILYSNHLESFLNPKTLPNLISLILHPETLNWIHTCTSSQQLIVEPPLKRLKTSQNDDVDNRDCADQKTGNNSTKCMIFKFIKLLRQVVRLFQLQITNADGLRSVSILLSQQVDTLLRHDLR